MKKLEDYVRSIPDFPEPGIIFRDVTSILQDADGLHLAIDGLMDSLKDVEYDVVVGPESRGFIFGVPVAYEARKGFIPVRKKGKLPCEVISEKYDLEYGTIEAITSLVEQLGGEVVRICFVMELAGLKGREKLAGYHVDSLITYEGK